MPHPTFCQPLTLSQYLDDFKPASVDVHKEATLETGSNNTVTVTLPHLGKYYFSICFVIIFLKILHSLPHSIQHTIIQMALAFQTQYLKATNVTTTRKSAFL